MNTTIGIIGGRGKMGAFFTKIFEAQGHRVLVSDKDTKLTPKHIAEEANIIMISVPIEITTEVIRQVAPLLNKNQILCDITSIKTEPIKAMLESEAEVIGLHPMFGPTADSLKKQLVISCPARISDKNIELVEGLFTSEGAHIKRSTPEKHDEMMGVIQVLMHAHSVILGNVLRECDIDIKESLEYLSPIYQLEFNVIGRIFAQNPKLYGTIAMKNPVKEKLLNSLLDRTEEVVSIIKKDALDEYVTSFNKTSSFLDEFKDQAMEESDRIISIIQDN